MRGIDKIRERRQHRGRVDWRAARVRGLAVATSASADFSFFADAMSARLCATRAPPLVPPLVQGAAAGASGRAEADESCASNASSASIESSVISE